ncbi:MAG: MlaD family protein [Pseudomonadota bacterium]
MKEANKTLVGAFVVGAVVLAVTGVLLFGSGRFLSERKTFVCYFTGSVKGLAVGSPVDFRGVKVGSVIDIRVRFYPKERSFMIPVLIEIDPTRLTAVGHEGHVAKITQAVMIGGKTVMEEMINRGLRAQLQSVSLVTGQLGVDLDFYPKTPKKLVGTDQTYPEIPTIPSSMEQLQNTFEKFIASVQKLPLDTMVDNLAETAKGLNKVVNSPEVGGSIRSLNQTLDDLRTLLNNLNNQVRPLASGIEGTVQEVRGTVKTINQRIEPLAASIEQSVDAARVTLEQTQKALANVERITSENSALRHQLLDMMEQVSAAARSMRIMADYLEQHPEALLRGKGKSGGE